MAESTDAELLNDGRENDQVITTGQGSTNEAADPEAALLARVYSFILSWDDVTTEDSASENGNVGTERGTSIENAASVNLGQIPTPEDDEETDC